MSSKGAAKQPARVSARIADQEPTFESRDFALARDRRRKARKAAAAARKKNRR